jgi:hypothetical protein
LFAVCVEAVSSYKNPKFAINQRAEKYLGFVELFSRKSANPLTQQTTSR